MPMEKAKRNLERIKWYEKMVEAYKNMPDEMRQVLDKWDIENKEKKDISEWPGWETLIGKKP